MLKRILSSAVFILFCFSAAAITSAETPTVAPLIQPLADMGAYASADYHRNKRWHFRYPSPKGERQEKLIFGDGWEMVLPKAAAGSIDALEKFIPEQNATLYSRSGNEVFFSAAATEAETWWIRIEDVGNDYRISQARQVRLATGSSLRWNLGEGGSKEVHFYTEPDGARLTHFKVELQSGAYGLSGEAIINSGKLRRAVNYSKRFNAEYDKIHVLNDIPKGIGEPVHWHLWRTDNGPAAGVSISLVESADLPSVKATDALGALKVRGAAGALVEAAPLYSVSVFHEQLKDFASDATPEGDALLWLPAGLWNIRITPPESMPGIDYIQSCLVPVSSGETTVLNLPGFLKTTLSEQQGSTTFENRKGLNIAGLNEAADGVATATFSLFDRDMPDMAPALENTTVLEGGAPGEIKAIERVKTPASVVLLLDSSGSMKGQMRQTVEAARQFIASLPGDTVIQVVDFDTRPRELPGTTREEVLSGLDGIRADGATALYDTILKGLDLLDGRQRPSLLVFTDGVDANWNDTGPGSTATRDEVFAAVRDSAMPLYTIGFGPGHDNSTLTRLAEISGGLYYSAVDPKALEQIFETIKNDLGNTFELRYKRPAVQVSKSVPVISIAIDTSGSMDPLAGGILQKVKNLFHDFILKLPDQTLVQLQDYDTTTIIRQLLTTNKSELLQALGELVHRGNNDTFKTVKTALETLQPIPSAKKILIYVSDQDLGLIRESEKEEFETLLKKFKEEDIKVLWVGFCMDEAKDVFVQTAELSGGEYVISEDPEVLARAFDAIVAEVSAAKPDQTGETDVRLVFNTTTDDGTVYRYTDSKRFSLSAPETVEQTVIPNSVSYDTGLPFEKYNPVTRNQLSGDDYPDRDIVISKQIPLDVKIANEAAEIRALEAISLARFKGLDAPRNRQFMAVVLEMTNILPEQDVIVYPDGGSHPAAWAAGNASEGKKVRKIPSYLINDITSHFFLSWNNKGKYPVSPVTWLAENPFVEPGSLMRYIEPGHPVRGVVLFAVPDERLEQASLHFYDKNYGHAELPLVGKLKENDMALEALPFENEVTLSESFSLAVKGVKDVEAIESAASEKDCVFRVVEADFRSDVQALIDVNPLKYFYYRIVTEKGPLYMPIAPATQLLPFGFTRPVMFAPGSANRVRFAFSVPQSLAKTHRGELFVELGDGDVVVPLGDDPQAPAAGKRYSGDGIDLVVNRLAPTADNRFLVADVTLSDHPDGNATRLINAFELVRDDFDGKAAEAKSATEVTKRKGLGGFANSQGSKEYLVGPDEKTGQLLFGLDGQATVFDGTVRRGFVLFKMPSGKDHTWTLQSDFFADLKKPVDGAPFPEKDLLVQKSRPLLEDDTYKEKLNKALARAIRKYQALQAAGPEKKGKRVSIDGSQIPKETVPVPPVTFAGLRQFSEINDLGELKSVLDGLRWLPGEDGGWIYNFAPEAVLTQGWGTEVDFARMAEKVLVRMGYAPEKRMVSITAKGSDALAGLGRLERMRLSRLPAVYYKDRDDREHLLVFPFMKEFDELKGLVAKEENQDFYTDPGPANIEVFLKVVPRSRDRNTQMRDMSNVLAGGDSGDLVEEIEILDEFLDLDTLSMDAIDLGYTVVGRGKGDLVSAVLETARERITGKGKIDTGLYRVVGERISVRIGQRGGLFTHETALFEEDDVTGLFHALGINLPDVTESAAGKLQKAADNRYRSAQKPDEVSALRWYTRNIINRFLTGQSRYERELAAKLELTTGRTADARCLVVTVRRDAADGKLLTSIDLMRVENQIHKGEATARHAFNIFSGLHASKLEAEVLPGKHLGLFDLWRQLPEGTHLVSVTHRNKGDILAYMEDKPFPRNMIEHIRQTKNAVLIPSKPATVDGKERWAWLEINPEDFRTIAVLDTGEHGAMLEHVLGNWQQEGTNFVVGALIGVDAAIWSMSTFSLALEDYDEIKKQAQEFAKGLAENLDIGGTPSVSASMGPVSGSFDLVSGEKAVSQNLLGYSKGFSAGVSLFFAIPE